MIVLKDMTMTQQINAYLTALRDSGKVNMMGATPYLQRDFGMTRYQARDALLHWINTFKQGEKS
jgi:hypothetical protein